MYGYVLFLCCLSQQSHVLNDFAALAGIHPDIWWSVCLLIYNTSGEESMQMIGLEAVSSRIQMGIIPYLPAIEITVNEVEQMSMNVRWH